MKKIILFIAILGLTFTSCDDDFLDEKSPDKLTADNFYRDKSDAESALAASYSQMEAFVGEWYYEINWAFDLFRDELLVPGTDANNYDYFTNIFNFQIKNDNWCMKYYWKHKYKGINYANQVITKVGEMNSSQISDNDKKQIIAEAKFLRAYYHYRLLLNWEKIIIRDKMLESESDIDKPLSDRKVCWEQVVADFEEAAKDMIAVHSSENIGRATKYAAHAYVGKVYLIRATEEKNTDFFKKAADHLKVVYESNKFELLDDMLANFDGRAQNSKESIFEYQLTNNTSNGASHVSHYHMMSYPELGGWEETKGHEAGLMKMKKEGKLNTKYSDAYDSRLYTTFYFKDVFFNDTASYEPVRTFTGGESGKEAELNTFDSAFVAHPDAIAIRKYSLYTNLGEKSVYRSGVNVPLMRYSDVLLMYAESLTLQASPNLTLAKTCINQVRKRANMPNTTANSQAEIFSQIKHERLMEFAGEGHSFFDARRWGELKIRFGSRGYKEIEDDFFPIPEEEAQVNPLID